METTITPDNVQIQSDGKTVWVNTPNGNCIARFGKMGIDIHHDDTNGKAQCLYCTHELTQPKDWKTFQEKTKELHNVEVTDEHKPTRFN